MNDKPKRKRSESVKTIHSKRRLIVSALAYSLSFIPYLLDNEPLLTSLIDTSFAISALGLGSFALKILRKLKPNFFIALTIVFTVIPAVIIAWLLFTKSAMTGWLVFMGLYPLPLYVENTGLLLLAIIPFVCLWLTLELHFLMIHFLNAFPNYEVKKRKNVMMEAGERELKAEPDIPFELFAESESTEQAQR